jgi:hypothetical protein
VRVFTFSLGPPATSGVCWFGYTLISSGLLRITPTLRVGPSLIQGTAPDWGARVDTLIVEANTTTVLALVAHGVYLSYTTIEASESLVCFVDRLTRSLQYLGEFVSQNQQVVICGNGKGQDNALCPVPGSLAVAARVGAVCPILPCGACTVGQTCDPNFGLCQGAALFSVTETTLAPGQTTSASGGVTGAAARQDWVVPVAVAVPIAVVGVAAAVLLVALHRRSTAAYDRTANKELKQELLDETQRKAM